MKYLRAGVVLLAVLFVALVGYYRFWFLRNPIRKIPGNEKLFVSPANGKIVSVKAWNKNGLVVTKEDFGAINVWTKDVDTAGTVISIQMDLTNVHYQRAPTSGKIVAENYVHGSFHDAVTMSNEYGIRFENEHNEFLIENASGRRYKVIQIAGFLARRIVTYENPGDAIKQGQTIGLIKMGSQVTVILPHDVKIDAHVGETVTDGESILAEEM